MSTGFHELRIDLQDWKNETKYAAYQIFSIDFEDRYRLKVMGYSGSAGSFHTVNIYVLGKINSIIGVRCRPKNPNPRVKVYFRSALETDI